MANAGANFTAAFNAARANRDRRIAQERAFQQQQRTFEQRGQEEEDRQAKLFFDTLNSPDNKVSAKPLQRVVAPLLNDNPDRVAEIIATSELAKAARQKDERNKLIMDSTQSLENTLAQGGLSPEQTAEAQFELVRQQHAVEQNLGRGPRTEALFAQQRGTAAAGGFGSAAEARRTFGKEEDTRRAAAEVDIEKTKRLRDDADKRPGEKFRRIEQEVARNQQNPKEGMTPEAANEARQNIVKLDQYGAAARAEALRQGIKLSSAESQTMGTIADLTISQEMLRRAMNIDPEQFEKFTGISGRALRAFTGVTGGTTDFLEVFAPDDRAKVENWMTDQFAFAMNDADDDVRQEIRDSGFLIDRELLGTFDAYILASQIALARSQSKGGRITKVALDQAKEQIDPNRFTDSAAVKGAFRGAQESMGARTRVLKRQLVITQGRGIIKVIDGLSGVARQVNENPSLIPTELPPERQQELDTEIADELQRENDKGLEFLGKEAKEGLDLLDAEMERIEREKPRSLRDAAGANFPRRVVRDQRTGQPVRGTGAAAREQGFRPASQR